MQVAVIDFAQHVCGLEDAMSVEFDPNTPDPVIHLKRSYIINKGGTMRLGQYPCDIKSGTKLHDLYKADLIYERHRHRYDNPKYKQDMESKGLVFSAFARITNWLKLLNCHHPYFVACQFHPEFKSRPLNPHHLFYGFVEAAKFLTGTQQELFVLDYPSVFALCTRINNIVADFF